MTFLLRQLLLLALLVVARVHSFVGPTTTSVANHHHVVALASTKEVMSDVDIMCLENAADLCSYYDECDIEEREAILNRFASETEIMVDRIATMTALVRHLKTGDHQHLEDEEVESLKQTILGVVDAEAGLSP
eukprot:jgi/Psemu1/314392/fgenesh1_kg.1505_\